MSFPRYPEYKDSGVEWLGEVPEGWAVTALKRVVNPVRQITYGIVQAGPNFEDGIPYIRPADMTPEAGIAAPDEILRTSPEIAADYTRSTIRTGDLVCSIGPSFGKVMVTPSWLDGANLTQGTARIAVDQDHSAKFVFWTLRAPSSVAQWESSVGGATFRALNLGPLARTMILTPPLPEQTAIAEFLDRETGKIDELVAEQRRLMELLKEKRQAVISHAVTKGLNPHAPMKPSGIEWLGDVPVGWEVKRLKSIVEEPLKYGANESAELDDRTLPRFVRITDIDESGALRDETFKSLPVDVAQPFLLREGDVLLARSGATVGKSFIFSNQWGPACFAGYLIRARLRQKECLAQWLYYFCQTNGYWGYVVGSQIQATIQNVSAEKYANLYLTVPSIAEQRTIIKFLETELVKFDTLTAEAQRAIDLLQERRTALISAAVTGQIDVRSHPKN